MARKKFKLSKSLLARLAAITVLVGMGGLAIVQSQMGGSDEVADGEKKSDEAAEDSKADKSKDEKKPEADAKKPKSDSGIKVVSNSSSGLPASANAEKRDGLPLSKPPGSSAASLDKSPSSLPSSARSGSSGLPASASGATGLSGPPGGRSPALGNGTPRLSQNPGSSGLPSRSSTGALSLPSLAGGGGSSSGSPSEANGIAGNTSSIPKPTAGQNDLRSASSPSTSSGSPDSTLKTPSTGSGAGLPNSATTSSRLASHSSLLSDQDDKTEEEEKQDGSAGLPPSTSLADLDKQGTSSNPSSADPTKSGLVMGSGNLNRNGSGLPNSGASAPRLGSSQAGPTALPNSPRLGSTPGGSNPQASSTAGSSANTQGATPRLGGLPDNRLPADLGAAGNQGSLAGTRPLNGTGGTGTENSRPSDSLNSSRNLPGGSSAIGATRSGSNPSSGLSTQPNSGFRSQSGAGLANSSSPTTPRSTPLGQNQGGAGSVSIPTNNSGSGAGSSTTGSGGLAMQGNLSRSNSPLGGTGGTDSGSRLNGYSNPSSGSSANMATQNPYANPNRASNSNSMTGNSLVKAADGASETPGGKDLDGAQTPSAVIEKRAPREIQVGRVATFETLVRNVGQADAVDVIVTDRIPAGTRLESLEPQPLSNAGGLVVWNLGELKPGQSKVISMNVTPLQKGEIGSVAQLTFNARAGVRTICTQPELQIQVQAPPQVLIGKNVALQIQVRNNGDGAASGVVIEEDVPDGLSHPEGREIQYNVGNLGPGESRQLVLTLRAESAAQVKNLVAVRADNNLRDDAAVQFEVVAPKLAIEMNGPKRRYLERKAIHTITIENSGTAAARNVEIVAYLPKGLKFEETNNHGTYDPKSHAVFWGLEQLPAGAADSSIQLVTLPVATGEQNIEYRANADLNLASSNRLPVIVEELAELYFDIDDVADPIEVNSDTLYELRITNQGSKVATQIELMVSFPQGMEPVNADGPTGSKRVGQKMVFDKIAKLAPGETLLYRIQARGQEAGDHRIEVEMVSAETAQPVRKQASTRVYSDIR